MSEKKGMSVEKQEELLASLVDSAINMAKLEMKTQNLICIVAELLHKLGGQAIVSEQEGMKIRSEYSLRTVNMEEDDKKFSKLTLVMRDQSKEKE